jgi:hypothetical protein
LAQPLPSILINMVNSFLMRWYWFGPAEKM